ncbi:3-oxoacyl-[acyl-carrier-protein] synthase III C-terminal domain-containing protein [uncultured Albimonas sp.]|uniref:3-oxoacyl-[acyl-carrier-protein] synthase III C-terminal domain-containing protein n=1 Tax=uncultured Albimonas sp. TaxID=1331701 RepID=UPI0030ECABC1|tara:strand:- start:1387 stop:2880 length:1494 start_codon:yes stop_codon:yes gene_type:complete
MTVGILSYGGYLPKARLDRGAIYAAHAWFNPGLRGLAKGERALANWDEDVVTMAVEAVAACLEGYEETAPAALYLASTSFPFRDRQNAGIVADALTLPRGLTTLDLGGSQRAGSSALLSALAAARGLGAPVLAAASEKRPAKPASTLEFTVGDGAAALLVGEGPVLAEYVGGLTHAVDFVDHFRGERDPFDYTWEERWVRDEGYLKLVPAAVTELLEGQGVAPAEIARFCFPAAMANVGKGVARAVGLPETSVADNLVATCGETGAAHPLVMLVHALETAAPGDLILAVGFGQGVDALLFRATDAILDARGRTGVAAHLARGRADARYSRYLAINDLATMERGIRAEVDKQTKLSTHYRTKSMTQGMIGGACTRCGTKQFPKSRICVNPNCNAVDAQVDEPFSRKAATLNSWTRDQLTFSPDPPTYFGMVQFEGGGRLMSDLTDIAPGAELEVGTPMKMVFRIKDHDALRDFRRYFWKATPVEPAAGTPVPTAAAAE